MDRSGSMALNPDNGRDVGSTTSIPWGDKSKYHFALKGYFGIDNFLERQGVAPYIESCVIGFSGEKAVRGKSELVAKSLLTAPSGGTSLDVSGLERELDENALLLSISDGEVPNIERGAYSSFEVKYNTARQNYQEAISQHKSGQISEQELAQEESTFRAKEQELDRNQWKRSFEQKLAKCDMAHIQIGRQTDYSLYLQDINKPVIYVRGDNDLSKAMLSFVSSHYRQKPIQGGIKIT